MRHGAGIRGISPQESTSTRNRSPDHGNRDDKKAEDLAREDDNIPIGITFGPLEGIDRQPHSHSRQDKRQRKADTETRSRHQAGVSIPSAVVPTKLRNKMGILIQTMARSRQHDDTEDAGRHENTQIESHSSVRSRLQPLASSEMENGTTQIRRCRSAQ